MLYIYILYFISKKSFSVTFSDETKEKKQKTEVNGSPTTVAATATTATAAVPAHDAASYQYQQPWAGYAQVMYHY